MGKQDPFSRTLAPDEVLCNTTERDRVLLSELSRHMKDVRQTIRALEDCRIRVEIDQVDVTAIGEVPRRVYHAYATRSREVIDVRMNL